jgi:hypothetical protein
MVRRRPGIGPLDRAHAGVDTIKAGVAAVVWERANDPDRPVRDRSRL